MGRALRFHVLLICGSMICALTAQSGPHFDSASIRPNAPQDHEARVSIDPERLIIENFPLTAIVEQAYGVGANQLVGEPQWMANDFFTIQGSTNVPVSKDVMLEMLRNVLVEKFGLKVEIQMRMVPVYDLVISKSGLKMEELDGDAKSSPGPMPKGFGAFSPGKTTEKLVNYLNRVGGLDRTVIDKTGLKGQYNIWLRMEYTDEGNGIAVAADRSSDQFLREIQDIGLELVPSTEETRVVTILSIDHFNAQ